jgi:signal transduction histidine kinase
MNDGERRVRVVLGADGTVLAADGAAAEWIGTRLEARTDVPAAVRSAAAEAVAAVRDPARRLSVASAVATGDPSVELVALEAVVMRRSEVALVPLVHDALAALRAQAAAADVALVVHVAPEVTRLVVVDPEKTAWAVATLVGNALRYVRHGTRWRPGGAIDVELARDAGSGELVIRVGDDGPGIAHERLPWLLARAPGATRSVGMALMLVRDVVAAHGGRIAVDSRNAADDHGTTFTIWLPAR